MLSFSPSVVAMTRANPRAGEFLRTLYDDIASEQVSPTVTYGDDRRPDWFCVQTSATDVVWYGERVSRSRATASEDTYRILRIDPSFTRQRPKPQNMLNPSSWDPNSRESLSACNCQIVDLELTFTEEVSAHRILGQVQDSYFRGGRGRNHFTVRDGSGLAKMYQQRF